MWEGALRLEGDTILGIPTPTSHELQGWWGPGWRWEGSLTEHTDGVSRGPPGWGSGWPDPQ